MGNSETWIVEATGTEKPLLLLPEEISALPVAWSPNGEQLLFISDDGERLTPTTVSNLWVIDTTTANRKQLMQNLFVSSAAWSPDGQWVVFSAISGLEGDAVPYDLWLMKRDGSELKRLTSDPEDDLEVRWLTGSNMIVFRKSGAGVWELDMITGIFEQIYTQDAEYVTVINSLP